MSFNAFNVGPFDPKWVTGKSTNIIYFHFTFFFQGINTKSYTIYTIYEYLTISMSIFIYSFIICIIKYCLRGKVTYSLISDFDSQTKLSILCPILDI